MAPQVLLVWVQPVRPELMDLRASALPARRAPRVLRARVSKGRQGRLEALA